ncbi:MAG: LAGLIDADG family homing endonuclease [Nanoarchaeota archaeon]
MPYDIILGRDESDKKLIGKKGIIYLGKSYVKMGQYTSLSNNLFMDIAKTHVVLVAGKRGCLTGETLIFTNEGYKPIKEFNSKENRVLSFNKEKKEFEWENAELLQYDISKEKLLEIELDDGRKLQLTKEHPLLVNYGKYLFWRMAQELKTRDKIILSTKLQEIKKNEKSLRLARILGFVLSDGTISKRKGRWKDGRGSWYNGTKSRLRIFCNDENVLNIAKKDLEEEFGLYVKQYKRNDCDCSVVQSLYARVVNKIHELGVPLGNKAGIIRIPKIVLESSNTFKAQFLSALFSCDGYIANNGKYIDYSSKSRKFLEDLQLILSHFEIESSIREKNAKCANKIYKNYRLFITDNSSMENFKKIGFISRFKQNRLEKHKDNKTRKRKTFYISDNLVCRRIKSIKEIQEINEVYDLSVNKNHSFIANGIISHNSGKSYTLGVIAEELSNLDEKVSQNIASLIFDTMGIYWTMKYQNQKDKELLSQWGLKPKNLPVKIFVPVGYYDYYRERGILADDKFSLDLNEMTSEDWILTFGLDMINPVAILIERVLSRLKEKKNFRIEDIIATIIQDKNTSQEIKNAAIGLFEAAKTWGIFSEKESDKTQINDLITPGLTTVLDLSVYNSVGAFNIRALAISLISRKIFNQRMLMRKKEEVDSIAKGLEYLSGAEKKEYPLVWIFIDEAHEFLPLRGKTIATDALIQLLREGRQPGISLVLATQQPGQIHKDVMTQADIVISHKITAKPDLEALNYIMQSYVLEGIKQQINNLPELKGSAIILDDNSERIYPMRIRPRFTWHGGEAPTAVKIEKRL